MIFRLVPTLTILLFCDSMNANFIGLKRQCFFTNTMKYTSEEQFSNAYMKITVFPLLHMELKPSAFLVCIQILLRQNFS